MRNFIFAPVAQWIEPRTPKAVIEVQFLSGAFLNLIFLENYLE